MKSVHCSTPPWAQVALIQGWPCTVTSCEQGWCFRYGWITGDYWYAETAGNGDGKERENDICIKPLHGLFVSVSLLCGGGQCHWCQLLGRLCRNTHGGGCYMGDCDFQGQKGPYALLAWPLLACHYPSQSPWGVTCLSEQQLLLVACQWGSLWASCCLCCGLKGFLWSQSQHICRYMPCKVIFLLLRMCTVFPVWI